MMPYACIGKVGVSRAHSTKRAPLRLVLKKAVATILQSLSSLLCSPPDLLLQAPLQTKHTTHHPSDTRGQFPVIPLTGVCAHVICPTSLLSPSATPKFKTLRNCTETVVPQLHGCMLVRGYTRDRSRCTPLLVSDTINPGEHTDRAAVEQDRRAGALP